MACITLEPGTKEVKKRIVENNKISTEHLYWEGRVGIKFFDSMDEEADGISLDLFKRTVKRQGDATLLHDAFEAKDSKGRTRVVPGRKAIYHGSGEFEFIRIDAGSKKYSVSEDVVKAFAVVADETMDNLPELNRLKDLKNKKNGNGNARVYGSEIPPSKSADDSDFDAESYFEESKELVGDGGSVATHR